MAPELKTYEKKSYTHKGYEFVGPNGNRIFLPFAGYIRVNELLWLGESGFYLTSTPYPNEGWSGNDYCYEAKIFKDSENLSVNFSSREFGATIRPVSD